MPICPDAIHKQLATAVVKMKKEFAIKYAKLPGVHRIYLGPCGDWFPEEQKPMHFELQASSSKPQAPSALKKTQSNDIK